MKTLVSKNNVSTILTVLGLFILAYLMIDPIIWITNGLNEFSLDSSGRKGKYVRMLSDGPNIIIMFVNLLITILSPFILIIPVLLVFCGGLCLFHSTKPKWLTIAGTLGFATVLIGVFYLLLDKSIHFPPKDQIHYVWPFIKHCIYYIPIVLLMCIAPFLIFLKSTGLVKQSKQEKQNEDLAFMMLILVLPITALALLAYLLQNNIRYYQSENMILSTNWVNPPFGSMIELAKQSPKLRRIKIKATAPKIKPEHSMQIISVAAENKSVKEYRLQFDEKVSVGSIFEKLSSLPLSYVAVNHRGYKDGYGVSPNKTIKGISISPIFTITKNKAKGYNEFSNLKNLTHLEFKFSPYTYADEISKQFLNYLLGPKGSTIEVLALPQGTPLRDKVLTSLSSYQNSPPSKLRKLMLSAPPFSFWDVANNQFANRKQETKQQALNAFIAQNLKRLFPSLNEIVFFGTGKIVGNPGSGMEEKKFGYKPLRALLNRHGIKAIFIQEEYPEWLEILFETDWAATAIN